MSRVLVVGDMMLDHYTHVSTLRNSEESSRTPVFDHVRDDYRLGGAANVAANVKAMSPETEVHIAGICSSRHVISQLDSLGIHRERVMGQETMVKRRFIADEQMVFRYDNMIAFSDGDRSFFSLMMNYWETEFDAVIFSDYDKGTLGPDIVSVFRRCAPLLVVDSKRRDLRLFSGMTVLKVNENEAAVQASSRDYDNYVSLFEAVVVTRGERGADVIMSSRVSDDVQRPSADHVIGRYSNRTEHFPTIPRIQKDVTGCGDTHTAALTLELLRSRDIRKAVTFANTAAGDVVEKFGTSLPNRLCLEV